MNLGWKWKLPLVVMVAALVPTACSGTASGETTTPPPDGYGPGPVTIVDSYVYLPGGPGGQWVYCWRPAHAPAQCQAIPHAPFDPSLIRQGIG